MNKKMAFASALLFSCLVSAAQTNDPPGSPAPLYFAPIKLWTASSNSITGSGDEDLLFKFSQSQNQLTRNEGQRSPGLETDLGANGEFYLTPAEPPSDSAFARAVDSVLHPEVITLGKTRLQCSIIKAIKRKNPLCLIDATVLKLSW
jgi:hypothetical protein